MRRWVPVALLLCFLPAFASAAGGRQPKAASPTLLFDLGHRQLFSPQKKGALQLSSFARRCKTQGASLKMQHLAFDDLALRSASGVVISGPFAPLRAGEIAALVRFVRAGGRLAVLLHIGPPTHGLLTRLGVSVSNGVLREPKGAISKNRLDFRVARLRPHQIVSGLKTFSLYGAWALLPRAKTTRALAVTSSEAWVDLDRDKRFGAGDAKQAFAVAVTGELGKGAFAVFGDDAIFQNRFLKGNNARLADNLIRWLAQGAAPRKGSP